jgi:DNA-binding response OmpR family regulator
MPLNAVIIDRDPTAASMILQRLAALGVSGRVCTAAAFGKTEEVADEATLVFVDLYNPDKEGIETILQLRARWPRLTIVAMAHPLRGVPAAVILELALGLGADLGLAKPIAPLALDSILDQVLARRALTKSSAASDPRPASRRPRRRDRRVCGGAVSDGRRSIAEPIIGL